MRGDFSLYKSSTIQRRITRRMVLNHQDAFDQYAAFLKGNAAELDALYSDVLISVTSFFRNPEAFAALQREVFPELLKQRGRGERGSADDPVRVWTLGCSTGQEAYSIAMSFAEFCQNVTRPPKLQVFATDLNDALLEKARHGLYAKTLAQDVSAEQLRRFFVEEEGGYRVSKALREQVVFARQNVLSDPPFSRLDLISCRNLLIYLETGLQKKIMPAFHYALKPGGFLFLGASESVGSFTELFEPIDKKQKIFARKAAPTPAFRLPLPSDRGGRAAAGQVSAAGRAQVVSEGLRGELDAQREADRVMVNQFAPPGVLVNAELQVLQFRGPTSGFLEPPTGKASFNVLKMARDGLMLPLRAAINKARRENKPVRRAGVRLQRDGDAQTIDLEVIPLKNVKERCYLILFEPSGAEGGRPLSIAPPARPLGKREESRRSAVLERELSETRDYLQSIQEQNEAANEELQASSEEVQSANEELQSINEELETSKEELESSNEELTTINEELANRNTELGRLNADLNNVQNSMNAAILLFSRDLVLRRFTPVAAKTFNLLAADVGRPFGGIRHNLDVPDLDRLLAQVIDTLSPREREVRDNDGRWYILRARPYLTLDNKIDGVVLMLVDIDALKRGEQEIKATRDYVEAILRTVRDPLLVLRADLRVHTANHAFYKLFKMKPQQTEGRPIAELSNGAWDVPKLRELLSEIIPRNSFFDDVEITHELPGIGQRTLLLNGRRIDGADGMPERILLAMEDVTEQRESQGALRASELRFRRLFEAAQDGVLLVDPVSRKITAANAFMARLLGYSREEFLGKELWQIGLLKDEGAAQAAFDELEHKGYIRYEDLPLESKSGQKREVEVVANLYAEDGHKTIQCNIRDITERKRAQDALRESERHRQLALDSAELGSWHVDPATMALTTDARFRRIFGAGDGHLDYEPAVAIIHPDDQARVRAAVAASMRPVDPAPYAIEYRVVRPDGQVRWVFAKGRANFGHDGAGADGAEAPAAPGQAPASFDGTVLDITDRKHAEDELRESEARYRTVVNEREAMLANEQASRLEAEAANRSKDLFLATLSHEMRTPLNAILGWATVLRGKQCSEADLLEGLEVIERNANAQAQLIGDVLDVSRIVSGKMKLEIRRCDLSDVIKAAIDVVRPAADAKDIQIETSFDPSANHASGDAIRIQQVVWNLLSNAVKFTPRGGIVRVELAREGPDTVITVNDNGPGIGPDVLPYVFDRFRQADSSTKRKYGGLGLGLSIVKHIAELHGGTVQAQSEGLGRGSTFVIRLPVRAVRPEEQEEAESSPVQPAAPELPAANLDGVRILFVDDEHDARRLVDKVLTEAGASVTVVESAGEAMQALSSVRPHVLISDLGMPDMDGFDLIRQVRSSGAGARELPAIALTAFAHADDQHRAMLAGFQVHVAKPVDPRYLAAVVASLAGRTGMPLKLE